ncbi:MAG: TIGR03960 family B12-binding radical SAM protein [Oscillospiraceae bacterium]|nr:TIGR03960 family B12-binding radical SAM protein [Oscillospiraceae bacterium]
MYKEKLENILKNVQKPARYIGGEYGSVIKKNGALRFAFCFPDTYEIGMSHLGMKILYNIINSDDNFCCERVFMPLPDMADAMRKNEILLYGLESLEAIRNFDFIGFTLQYELTYTNLLAMLDLAGLELLASDRNDTDPIVIGGGPCACNPEPIADFFDMFVIGEGEEVILEILQLYKACKSEGFIKSVFLEKAAQIKGVYVPSLYNITYKKSGEIDKIIALKNAPETVKKCLINNINDVLFPDEFVVPFCDIVHDRAVIEILRGCIRGCRFCQAGFIYRPFREKSAEKNLENAVALCENTGYDEVSLSSLSTGDYSEIELLLTKLTNYCNPKNINLSLPSMRIDSFSDDILQKIKSVRKSGLTFAPEAGTAKLRDIINKNITEDEIMKGCKVAFEGGYTSVKLYFMLGLPGETDEDILGIKQLVDKIIELYYNTPNRQKGKQISISVSLSTFIPKPFTPFQFEPQLDKNEVIRRRKLLLSELKNKKVSISWSSYDESLLEAALARGDRRLGQVILNAYKNGSYLDGWEEYFNFSNWEKAFADCQLDMSFYANRRRDYAEIPPWGMLDFLVDRDFLIEENRKAHAGITTPSCREKCAGCGVSRCLGGARLE